MSKPILKHFCQCNGTGWFFDKDAEDWNLCIAGCEPPKPKQEPQGVLAMQKDWQRQFGKAVA